MNHGKNRGKRIIMKQIGKIYVDSGTIIIGDPCYFLHTRLDEKEFGKGWKGYCDITEDMFKDGYLQIGKGTAVTTCTLYGDGAYPVYAEVENNRIVRVMIDFDPIDEDDDDY